MSATIAQNKENKPEPSAYEKVMKQLKAANRPWSLSTLNKNNKNHSGGKRTKASDQHQEETQEEPQQETQEDITYESLETLDEAHNAAISKYPNLTKAVNQFGRNNPYLNGSMPTNLFKKKSQESSGKESVSAGESKEQEKQDEDENSSTTHYKITKHEIRKFVQGFDTSGYDDELVKATHDQLLQYVLALLPQPGEEFRATSRC